MLEAITQQRDRGAAVVFISSEPAEIVAIADRALVIRDGLVAGSIDALALDERRLVALAAGG
jgi:ABC-type sugar transport system ATPase subunit